MKLKKNKVNNVITSQQQGDIKYWKFDNRQSEITSRTLKISRFTHYTKLNCLHKTVYSGTVRDI